MADPSFTGRNQWHDDRPVRLGVSSCLLGNRVRYDGGHQHSPYVTEVLGAGVEWVPVCPEVELGLGTPRNTIQLVEGADRPSLLEPSSGTDLTEKMENYANERVGELRRLDLDGFVLKASSPSCGMEKVKVFSADQLYLRDGVGIFARELMRRWPNLPVTEEQRLDNPRLRELFIEQLFTRHRWRSMKKLDMKQQALADFHCAHELLIRAHNETSYRRLSGILARAGSVSDSELMSCYETELNLALSRPASRKGHVRILGIAYGRLQARLDAVTRREMERAIDRYRSGKEPLLVPTKLLRHHAAIHEVPSLLGQLYLEPHPRELALRYRV